MYCNKCGNKLPDESKFCPNCGTTIDSGNKDAKNIRGSKRDARNKPGNKGLKITFFCLLGLVGVLLAVLIVVLASNAENKMTDDQIIKDIVGRDPQVDMQELSGWDKGAFSISNIASGNTPNLSDYMGVWRVLGTKADAMDADYIRTYDSSSGNVYIAIDDNNVIHSITQLPDGVISSHETTMYTTGDGYLQSDPPQGAAEGSILKYDIVDGQLTIANYLEDSQLSECYIYEKASITLSDLINGVHLQETETIEPAQTQQYEIESQIIGKWERANEETYYGCEFYEDGTFLYIVQQNNDAPVEALYTYQFIDENNMILNGDPSNVLDVSVDYEFGEYYLVFDDGDSITELFRVDEFSTNPVMESDEAKNTQADELVYNIEMYLNDTYWISTGKEYENPNVEEYTRTYDFEYGDIQYEFKDGMVAHSEAESEYIGDPEGYYIYAFFRQEEIDGEQRQLYNMFFIEGQYLYEVEMMDENEISNYIQYEMYMS